MPPVWHFFIICFFSSPGVGVYMMICVWHQSHPALWGTLQKQHFPQSRSVLKSILNQAVQDQPVQSWPRAEDKRASGWNGSWPGFLEKWWGAIPSHPCLCFAMPFRSWSWPWQLQLLPCHALFQWQLLTLSVTRLVPLLTVCSTSPKSEQPLCSKKPSPKQSPGCQGRDRESWVGTTTAVRCYISLNCKKKHSPHLCSCPTPGMMGHKSSFCGDPAPSDPALSLSCIMQVWSWWPPLPFLPLTSFLKQGKQERVKRDLCGEKGWRRRLYCIFWSSLRTLVHVQSSSCVRTRYIIQWVSSILAALYNWMEKDAESFEMAYFPSNAI